MAVIAHCRSWLFVPGNRPEWFGKAHASGTDAVVLDLEDAVAPDGKSHARTVVADWLGTNPGFVRINAANSPFHRDDLQAVVSAHCLQGIVLPKSEHVQDLVHLVSGFARTVPVVALVETALGVHDATRLARVPGVARLAFGALDFALDADTGTGPRELLYARSRLVIASRVAGIAAPVDSVTPELDDPAIVTGDAQAARELGFGGKFAVHPSQVPAINSAFEPTETQRDWAGRVLEAASKAPNGAARVDGQMVDRPVVERARRILARTPRSFS